MRIEPIRNQMFAQKEGKGGCTFIITALVFLFCLPQLCQTSNRQQQKQPLTQLRSHLWNVATRKIQIWTLELLQLDRSTMVSRIKEAVLRFVSDAVCPPEEFRTFFPSLRGQDLLDRITPKRRQRFTLQVCDSQMCGRSPSWHWNNGVLFCSLFLGSLLLRGDCFWQPSLPCFTLHWLSVSGFLRGQATKPTAETPCVALRPPPQG